MVVAPEAVIRLSPAAARSVVAVVAGLFGLFIGSFLNVVIYRVPRGLSIVRPRSFCPSCGTPVRPVDNVPVLGWLALGGKCRSCRSPISPRYPLVEGLTGGLFASIGLLVGPHLTVPALCALAATFVPLVAIELDRQASPPGVSLIGGGLGLALFVIPSARSGNWGPLVSGAAGAGAALAATGVVWATTRPLRPVARRRIVGASCALVPLGVLLGWVGAGTIAATVAGALTATAVTVVAGLLTTDGQGEVDGAWRVVAHLPIASAAGAVVGFGVAAAFGALAGS